MPLVLYGTILSPPVRATLLTLKALNLPYEFKEVKLLEQENLSEEYLKRNPQHTVPLLNDNDTWLWDSHAINAYLVSKYAKSDELYPKEHVQRAIVDQRLYFDASVLFVSISMVARPFFLKNITVVMKEKTEKIIGGYEFVEAFLGDSLYIAGDKMTIADFSCVSSVTSMRGIIEIDSAKYPKITAWLERMSKLPYYEEANGNGARQFVGILKSKLTEIIV